MDSVCGQLPNTAALWLAVAFAFELEDLEPPNNESNVTLYTYQRGILSSRETTPLNLKGLLLLFVVAQWK